MAVEERNIKTLEKTGPRTVMQDKTLTILKNMRDEADGVTNGDNSQSGIGGVNHGQAKLKPRRAFRTSAVRAWKRFS